MIGPLPTCIDCARLIDDKNNWHCEAFPKEIPSDIMVKGFDHHFPYPGDNNILFKEK
jgi:hypothetical protein